MITDFPNTKKLLAGMEQSGLDFSTPLKWRFYFYNEERQALNRLYEELSDDKFALESLSESSDGEWILEVSKVEVLSAETLHRRNMAFNELAEAYDVQLYDSWDVDAV
jgi:hypothetical protein